MNYFNNRFIKLPQTWKEKIIGLIIALTIMIVGHSCAKAASIETTMGGLTYHLWNPQGINSEFSNKISGDGSLIFTGLLGIGVVDEHYTYRVFIGQNSIGEQMFGSMVSYTWEMGRFRAGPVFGFYDQDDGKFLKKGIQPFSLGFGIVPIIGAEVSAKVYEFDDNKYIKLNTIVTPVILNETISFGADL